MMAAPATPRQRRRTAAAPSLRFRLTLPAPYDLEWIVGFLAERAAPSLERVGAAELIRVVRLGGTAAVIRVRPRPDPAAPRWLAVEGATAGPPIPAGPLRRLVRRMFDLDTDLAPFLALARRDPLLAPLVARHPGLRLPQLPDPFEGAVRAIVGQQVSVGAARTVVDRLIRQLGDPVPGGLGLFAFPRPAALAAAVPERLAALGLTRAKAAALIAMAAATRDGALDWERLRDAPPQAAQGALLALPGIGPWTASYIRMRALGDRDAFPASDLGIVKALAPHLAERRPGRALPAASRATSPAASPAPHRRGALDGRRPAAGPPSPPLPGGRRATGLLASGEITALAERWRPWRAYAAIHLWRSLSA